MTATTSVPQSSSASYPFHSGIKPVGDPTLVDAILDRVVHNAYGINLTGKSMRKEMKKLTVENQIT